MSLDDLRALVGEATVIPIDPGAAPRRPRSTAELVATIRERASEPWVVLGLDGAELASLRLGSWAALIGGPGAGKSTLTVALLAEHARLHGPSIYLSLELGGDETAARAIGMHVGASWVDVLRGRVAEADMLAALPERLIIVDRDADDVTLSQLDALVAQAMERWPGQPILVAVDYLQLAAGDGPDVRTRVSAVAELLRSSARRLRIVLVGVSQSSRAGAAALRQGELVGAETMAAGAESSAIERAAYVTIAIGQRGEPDGEGVAAVDLHLGKGRMGGGDRVLPALYDGRTGRWRIAGPAVEASMARARAGEAREAGDDARVLEALRAEPRSLRALCAAALGLSATRVRASVARLAQARRIAREGGHQGTWCPAMAAGSTPSVTSVTERDPSDPVTLVCERDQTLVGSRHSPPADTPRGEPDAGHAPAGPPAPPNGRSARRGQP
jgi:KaiC/GvpD/RAD55 family RecA-like ATPase